MAQQPDQPEYPRVEPEILPPDHSGNWQSGWGASPRVYQMRGTQRVYVTRLGPFGLGLLVLGIAVLTAAILFALIGALLLWVPIVALIVAAVVAVRIFRRWIF